MIPWPTPSRLLNDNETVSVDLHPHWWFLAGPILAITAAIAAAIVTLIATEPASTLRTVAGWSALAAIGLSALWLVSRYGRWLTTHFVITNRRVIFRTGLLTKRGIEIPIDRVNTVHFHQGVLERLVGTGDLLIESGGESGQQRFTDIRQPDRVQRVIHAEMEARERGVRGTDGVVDIADQLEKLESMLLRGTLTPEEFDRQKRRLLGLVNARVVSLVPSSTETLLALGAEVVACTRFCEQPDLRHVGGTKNPDVAAIVALAPDLVVLDREENRIEDHDALVAAGLEVFVSDVRSIDAGVRVVAELADAVGVLSPALEAIPSIDPPIEALAFVPIWRRPWMSISVATYGGSVLRRLGVELVTAEPPIAYPAVELDDVAARAPDLVLVPSEPYDVQRLEPRRTCCGAAVGRDPPDRRSGSLLVGHSHPACRRPAGHGPRRELSSAMSEPTG